MAYNIDILNMLNFTNEYIINIPELPLNAFNIKV